jgi:very-short-patch-repair endonuclease
MMRSMSEPKLDDCDRSKQSELVRSIEDCKHSDLVGAIGDLPTRTINVLPFGHPSLEKMLHLGFPQDRTFRSLEGISRREIIGSEGYLKELARKLRQNMTLSEVLLWQRLKRKQMRGYDFDRQRPINRYIVDFYCKDLKLAIEIDGSSHDGEEAKINDDIRQERLESLGVRFLRFTDADVKRNMEMVVDSIEQWIDESGL